MHCLADVAAGDRVTAGLEGRACDEVIHGLVLEHLHDARHGFIRVGAHEVIAADNSVGNLSVLQSRVVGKAGTDGAFHDEGLLIGLILAADAAEELIQI